MIRSQRDLGLRGDQPSAGGVADSRLALAPIRGLTVKNSHASVIEQALRKERGQAAFSAGEPMEIQRAPGGRKDGPGGF
jgi:hypothetical protein